MAEWPAMSEPAVLRSKAAAYQHSECFVHQHAASGSSGTCGFLKPTHSSCWWLPAILPIQPVLAVCERSMMVPARSLMATQLCPRAWAGSWWWAWVWSLPSSRPWQSTWTSATMAATQTPAKASAQLAEASTSASLLA